MGLRKFIARQTLSWVNTERHKQGKEPLPDLPRGWRADIDSCPVATSIGREYPSDESPSSENFIRIVHEAPAFAFAVLFDLGFFPQYDMGLPEKPKADPTHHIGHIIARDIRNRTNARRRSIRRSLQH